MAFGALSTGVSGLQAFNTGISVISDNIVNVNTPGYKESRNRFSTLVSDTQSNTSYTSGGVATRVQTLVSQGGTLNPTSSATDLGIEGAGFFVVRNAPNAEVEGQIQFTRAGNFSPDSSGFLRNAAGNYLQGFPVDSNGNLPSNIGDLNALEPINVNELSGEAEPTSDVGLRLNLQSTPQTPLLTAEAGDFADGSIIPQFAQTISIFDSQGNSHDLTISAGKVGTADSNTFRFEVYAQDPAIVNADATPPGLVLSGVSTFDTNGTLLQFEQDFPGEATLNPGVGQPINPQIPLSFANGTGNQSIRFNLGTVGESDGLGQSSSPDALISNSTNGAAFGSVTGTSVSEDGVVTALFDNGLTRDVYQLPLAVFPNPDGLSRLDGNAYGQSPDSGNFSVVLPGTGGGGSIAPSQLEASTVDLAAEFADLIVTQRSYSAATRIISTSDEILEELVRL